MPAEPLELWKSEPFEPEIRDGHIWARGADDDKGQSFIQVKAFEYLVRNELLQTNVKFIFEGEEEIGSPSLESFCQEHKELLKADVILVSDTSMLGADLPSLTTGLRGLAYWEIEVTGPNRDLHSGHFGGAVANPINVLCQIISQVTDAEGRITVPGFYDDVEEVPQTERDMIARIPFDEEKYKKAIHVKALFGEKGYSTLERNSCRPSFDVCGIWGGYTGEGSKTVLPSKAYAKVSCRLVPHQDHHKISPALCRLHSGHSAGFSTGKKSLRCMEAKDMYVPSPYPPTKPPKKVLKKLLERNRWQCVGVEVSPSSPLSSKYWASKPF